MSDADQHTANGPFEGPEKLLEIWFAPTAAHVSQEPSADGRFGLRQVDRQVWEDMLEIVQCKVLSVVNGVEMDAYLLRCVALITCPNHTEYIQVNPPSSSHLTSSSSKPAAPPSTSSAYRAF